MSPRLACVLVVSFCLHGISARAQGWEWQNPLPHGHRINDILSIDPDRVIAVCNDGYYMRSDDGGSTWSTSRIPGSHTHNVRIARTGDGSLLVAAARGRIFRSTNEGATWTRVFDARLPWHWYGSTDLVAYGENVFAILSGSYLALSRDFGRSWENVPLQLGSESVSSAAMQSESVWWVCGNSTLFRSTDAGRSWSTDASMQATGLLRLVFVDSLTGYQLRSGRLLQTRDGCGTWSEMNIFGFGAVIDLDAGHGLGDAVFALSSGNYLLNISTDAGSTWNLGMLGSAFPDASPTAVSFSNARTGLVAGAGGRVYRTSDGGMTWTMVSGAGYVGSIEQLVFTDAMHGIARTSTHTMLRTTDGGDHWFETVPDPDAVLRDVRTTPGGQLIGFALLTNACSFAYRSTDNGATWQRCGEIPYRKEQPQFFKLQRIAAATEQEWWIGATECVAYRSTDGGMHWDSLIVEKNNAFGLSGNGVFCFPPAWRIYSQAFGVSVSSDGGATWELRQVSGATQNLTEVQFLSPDIGYCLRNDKCIRTRDGGRTWQPAGDLLLRLLTFTDATHGFGLWRDPMNDDAASIVRTTNGGDTWTIHPTDEYMDWHSWFFLTPELGWAAGTDGGIRQTRNGGISRADDVLTSEEFGIASIYPHPLSLTSPGAATVTFRVPAEGPVRMTVSDVLGRMHTVLLDAALEPGIHSIPLETEKLFPRLPAGMYLLTLTSGTRRTIRPILLTR